MPSLILFATLSLFQCCDLNWDLLGEARDGAFVADEAVAFDNDFEDDGVVVAVGGGGNYTKAIAAGFAFHPKLLAGTAPEGDESGFEGFGVADGVEEAEHEDLAGSGVLNYAGDEAVHFGEIDLGQFGRHLVSLISVGPLVLDFASKSKKPAGVGAGGL